MQLVIDSATAACSVALLGEDGEPLAELHEVVGRGHAERLVPMIAELLDGRRPAAILVDCGPGSFTGVRVGLAAAHGLAIGWRVPLAGFSSLALLAAAHRDASELGVAVEGGHGELFVQSYGGDPLAATTGLRSLAPSAAALFLRADLVVGSGAELVVAARGHGRAVAALPRAADARLLPPALRSLQARPIYGRAPDAKPMT
jgi:tRNA threonylcarbamoyladenosine biosynthesis protein TsaB